MPTEYIKYNGNDRPYVQFQNKELWSLFSEATQSKDIHVIKDIYYETTFRKRGIAKELKSNIQKFLEQT